MFYREDGGDKVLPYLPVYRLGEFYLIAANPESAYKVKKVDHMPQFLKIPAKGYRSQRQEDESAWRQGCQR
jgi:hypothetical protein